MGGNQRRPRGVRHRPRRRRVAGNDHGVRVVERFDSVRDREADSRAGGDDAGRLGAHRQVVGIARSLGEDLERYADIQRERALHHQHGDLVWAGSITGNSHGAILAYVVVSATSGLSRNQEA